MAEFIVTIDGEDHELTQDNHGVAMFRNTPEYDYLDLRVPVGPEEDAELKHILVFRQQWLCHWMGNIALNTGDYQRLAETHAELSNFRERYGWNSTVLIEDEASSFEVECYTESLMNDLRAAEGLPEGWDEQTI